MHLSRNLFCTALLLTGTSAEVSPQSVSAQSAPIPQATSAPQLGDLRLQQEALLPAHVRDVDCLLNANRYQIKASLAIALDQAIIQGTAQVRYTNRSAVPLREIVFRLYPNIESARSVAEMKIGTVQVQGKAVKPVLSVADTVLTVPLQAPLQPGAIVELTLNFTTQIDRGKLGAGFGRIGYVDQVITAGSWYPALSVYERTRGWWVTPIPPPITSADGSIIGDSDPTYSETSLFDVEMQIPARFTWISNGQIRQTTAQNGQQVVRAVTGPMREHMFTVSPRYAATEAIVNEVTIKVWYYRDRAQATSPTTIQALRLSQKALAVYNKQFGSYPYKTLHVVQNPVSTGLEFPGLVLINDRAWEQGRMERVLIHEIGHQWFYGLVGNNQVEHPWLDEGLATYSEFVYQINDAKPDVAQKLAIAEQGKVQELSALIDRGELPNLKLNLPVADFKEYYGLFAYRRGRDFYLFLETQLGRATVYQALQQYVSRFRYEIVTAADLKQIFERTSGKDLTAQFDRWVGISAKDDKPAAIGTCTNLPSKPSANQSSSP
jgi:hypothetical protein